MGPRNPLRGPFQVVKVFTFVEFRFSVSFRGLWSLEITVCNKIPSAIG